MPGQENLRCHPAWRDTPTQCVLHTPALNASIRLGYYCFTSPSKAHSQALSHRALNIDGSLWGIVTCYFSFSSV